ncbi:hypothetical protein FRC03_001327 [Tulasnella sp. 419]|nr:hypothetical protein FRC03_001327 [Tulasnella sp. 419]
MNYRMKANSRSPSTPQQGPGDVVYSPAPNHQHNSGRYYAIRCGLSVGIFNDYNDVQPLVAGVSFSCYQRFSTKEMAHEFLTTETCIRKGCRGKLCTPVLFKPVQDQTDVEDSEQFVDDVAWDIGALDAAFQEAAICTAISHITSGTQSQAPNAQPQAQHIHTPPPPTPAPSPAPTSPALPLEPSKATVVPIATPLGPPAIASLDMGVPLHTYLKVHHSSLLDHIQYSFDTDYKLKSVKEFTEILINSGLSRAEAQLVLLLFSCQ